MVLLLGMASSIPFFWMVEIITLERIAKAQEESRHVVLGHCRDTAIT